GLCNIPVNRQFGLTDVHRKSTRASLWPRAFERCDLRPSIQKESAVAISVVADAVTGTPAVGLLARVGRQDGALGWGTECQGGIGKAEGGKLSPWTSILRVSIVCLPNSAFRLSSNSPCSRLP